jgi:altronate dehydratase
MPEALAKQNTRIKAENRFKKRRQRRVQRDYRKPLAGKVSDLLISYGASAVLTEVPEMFGAETLLMERCESREIFDKTVRLINDLRIITGVITR